MKEEFLNLLKTNFDKKYLEVIKEEVEDGEHDKIKKAILESDLNKRELSLEWIFRNFSNNLKLKKLANPFYIGFGDPNSKILIIGKEKAFDINNTSLLIKESINNYSQWVNLIHSNSINSDQKLFVERCGFSPLLPKAYHDGKTKRRHTWGIINLLIKEIFNENDKLRIDELQYINKSIFSKCFLTELNYIPSKYNEGTGLSETRKTFLKHIFFKSFPVVIIGAKSYFKNTLSNCMKEIFNASFDKDLVLDIIGRKRERKIIVNKYQSKKQQIYICNQLSGGAGWSNGAINNFGKLITSILIKS